MCLAIPGQILEITDEANRLAALVEVARGKKLIKPARAGRTR